MVSGSQATVRTCNDYSGSNVRRFCSRCGRHETLSLLTVITIFFAECIIEPAHLYGTCSELRACQNFNGAIKRKCRNWHNYFAVLVTFIYLCIYLYISIHINIISFPFLYGFLKTKYLNKIGKKFSREGGGGCLKMAISTDACLGGHFVSNHFCVEPCILLSIQDNLGTKTDAHVLFLSVASGPFY